MLQAKTLLANFDRSFEFLVKLRSKGFKMLNNKIFLALLAKIVRIYIKQILVYRLVACWVIVMEDDHTWRFPPYVEVYTLS